MVCKRCKWDYSPESINETTIKAHEKGLCTQCYMRMKFDQEQDKPNMGLFGAFLGK